MQSKPIFFRGDDGGFADRFQHAPALQGHHGAQHYQHRAALGAVRAMPQLHHPLKHQQLQQQHQVHQQQSRPVLGMHRDASASERGVFPRPHRVVAPHDSNDDDGETSSASEDSALSGGYPSPTHAGARPPLSFGKRTEPSSSFGLETCTVSKRSRTQQQSGWSAAASESAGAVIGGGGGGGNARQLPRMAALESFQQQARDQHLHHHQEQRQQQQQQQQQQHHRRQSSVGSHASASSRMAAPMQLPPLSVARAPPSTTSSPATSPGLRATSPPAAGGLRLQQHVQQHHGQHHPHARHPHHTQHHHASQPRQPPRHHHHAHPIRDHPPHLQVETLHHPELPAPGGTARALAQPWLQRDVEGARQIPRIEALRASAPAPSACRWDPVWSKTTQGQTGNFNHVGYSAGYPEGAVSDRRAWRGGGIVREQGSAGAWPLHHEGDFQPRRSHPFEREDKRHPHQHTLRQPEVQILHRPEIAGSPRTPSPIFHHQPPLSRSSSAATSTASGTPHDRVGKPAWTSAIQDDREWARSTANHEPDGAGKQILERYLANLNPKASREVWSHDEEEVLWRAQREYGNAWNYISGLLPGRSENAVKNHWYTQMRMFIGQRGNHSTNSKPCPPPPPALDASVKAASPKECRQPKPFHKHEEEQVDAKSCAASVENDAGTTSSESGGGGSDARVEHEARAEAVAALGMLFAQRDETEPSVGGEKSGGNASQLGSESTLPVASRHEVALR